MTSLLGRLTAIYNKLEKAVARVIFGTIVPAYPSDRIRSLWRVRIACKLSTPFATVVLLVGFFGWSPKAVGAAGLIFDLIGVARLFLSAEWGNIVDLYADEEEYPYGPPSHIIRKLMGQTDTTGLEYPNEFERVLEMPKYYDAQRGLFFLLIGFFFQLVGLLMG